MTLMIFIVAILSLASNQYCWSDIKSGRPHIVSLRQILLVMDRNILNQLFGQPDKRFRYTLSPQMLAAFVRARRGYFYTENAADLLCIVGAWRYMNGMAPEALEYWFILLAGTCQAVSVLYSMWLVYKWGDQIREEID